METTEVQPREELDVVLCSVCFDLTAHPLILDQDVEIVLGHLSNLRFDKFHFCMEEFYDRRGRAPVLPFLRFLDVVHELVSG